MHELAAAYCFGLIQNHPFTDGNKRLGFLVMAVVLELNGIRFHATEESTTLTILALAAGELDESELADWIRLNSSCATSD